MEKNKKAGQSDQALQPSPPGGELQTQLRDKRIFGVYRDEEGTDRAIRQLHKLGYSPEDIYLYSKDEAKAMQVTEQTNQDLNILSCSDGSDFIGESYQRGDIVLCILRDAELFKKPEEPSDAPESAETAAEVHETVAEEKAE